jgi:hypothetical protein
MWRLTIHAGCGIQSNESFPIPTARRFKRRLPREVPSPPRSISAARSRQVLKICLEAQQAGVRAAKEWERAHPEALAG